MAKDAVHKWSKKLEVPQHMMAEVAEFISDKGLDHCLTGADLDEEIVQLEVYYDRNELDDVNELAEMIEDEEDE
ncbi:MAG: hypothetical protein K1X81_11525 [Bacteroidia bacterium]|nr:hypothetical protein [Bacteroidia bacterium]